MPFAYLLRIQRKNFRDLYLMFSDFNKMEAYINKHSEENTPLPVYWWGKAYMDSGIPSTYCRWIF